MSNGHLSIEEIEQLIQQKGPAEHQSHVESCQQCRSLLEDCQVFSAKLEKLASVRIGADRAMKCPDERVWFDVAAGTLPETESLQYVRHAAECDSCGRKLKIASHLFEDIVSTEEQQVIRSLPSANRDVQKTLAEHLASDGQVKPLPHTKKDTQQPKGLFLWWRPALTFVGVAAAAILGFQGYRSFEIREAQHRLDRKYEKGRPTEYRIAGVPYSSPLIMRGSSGSSYVEVPKWLNQPLLAARAAFLAHEWAAAAAILERANASGDNPEVLNDLVVAYALQAEDQGADGLYQKALATSNYIIKHYRTDSVVYLNRALIYQHLAIEGPANKHTENEQNAKLNFRQFIDLESDPAWKAEAKAKLQLLP